MQGDAYSRFVMVLKIILPLIALAILSTLFLFSARIEPGSTIPFADGEIAERIQGQQVTGPFFSGVTTNGDEITFSAKDLATPGSGLSQARDVSARLDFAGGGSVVMVANSADLDLEQDSVALSGNILIESTTGYKMRSDQVMARLSETMITSPGEVRATGPSGSLRAGSLEISNRNSPSGTQLLFRDGVKLIYDPKDTN